MTIKQKMLKWVYPIFNRINKVMGKNSQILVHPNVHSGSSFYDLQINGIDGKPICFSAFKNKMVLIVNTASDCGYTAQYEGLQTLHEKYGDQLVIIGIPANDFGEQEKADEIAINSFCKKNYGVEFLLTEKAVVVKSEVQHPVFSWLTDPQKNGWNKQAPAWNFYKFLIDANGELTHVLGSAVEPEDKRLRNAITAGISHDN